MIEFILGLAIGMSLWFVPCIFLAYQITSTLRGLMSKVSRVGNLFGPALSFVASTGASSLFEAMNPPRGKGPSGPVEPLSE